MPNFNYIIPGSPPDPLMPQARVRDSMGDRPTFGVLQGQGQYPSYLQQARSQSRQYRMPSLLPSPTNQNQNAPAYHTPTTTPPDLPLMMSQSQHSQPMKDWGTLPQDYIQKIVELKRLLYRHSNTFPNPEIIIQSARHFAMMGDISFLDEKIAYLRSVDTITSPQPPPQPQQAQQQETGQDNFVV
jgi:hypothetical protein